MKKIFLLGVIIAMSNASYYVKAADGDVLVRDIDTGDFYKINLRNHKPIEFEGSKIEKTHGILIGTHGLFDDKTTHVRKKNKIEANKKEADIVEKSHH